MCVRVAMRELGMGANADYAVIILALYYLITVTEFIMGSNEATKYTKQEKQSQQTAFNSSMCRITNGFQMNA